MYGYRDIGGQCVDCLTWSEALEIALAYSRYSDIRYRVEGDLVQHYKGLNISRYNQYCYKPYSTGEYIGNQRAKRQTRCK